MVDLMIKEMHLRKTFFGDNGPLSTIYFGGGTPSLLEASHLQSLMQCIEELYSIEPGAEVTIEANPDDISQERLSFWKEAGINRISLGVQSFIDDELRLMNRVHNSEMALRSIHQCKSHGFDDLSIDLIFGIQGSSIDSWKSNLDKVIELEIPHISCYNLTIEPRTALDHMIKTNKLPALDDNLCSAQFDVTISELENAGYQHYEISNYCLDGKMAKHNSNYWKGHKYLGIGPSAHSFDGEHRSWNVANNSLYIKSLEQETLPITFEKLSDKDRFNESLMTGLRTTWGVDIQDLEDRYKLIDQAWYDQLETFIQNGYLMYGAKDELLLTRKGKFYADQISSDLFIL